MPRPSQPKLTDEISQDTFRGFRNCGYLSEKMLEQEFHVNQSQLDKWLNQDLVSQHSYFNRVTERTEQVYSLRKNGRSVVKKELGLKNCYKSNSISHDLRVARKYIALDSDERNSCRVEKDHRDWIDEQRILARRESIHAQIDFEEIEKNIAAIDLSYVSNATGCETSLEVVGAYSEEQCASKLAYCDYAGIVRH